MNSTSWFTASVVVYNQSVIDTLLLLYDAVLDLDSDDSSSLADLLAEALPDALSLTTLQVDFSDLLDSLADFNFNIGNLAEITLDVSGVVDALEDYLTYSGYSAAQLLYLCWGDIASRNVV